MKNLFFYVSIALLSSITMFESHSMDKNQEAVLASKAKVMKTLVNNYIEEAARISVIENYAFGEFKGLKDVVYEAERYVERLHQANRLYESGNGCYHRVVDNLDILNRPELRTNLDYKPYGIPRTHSQILQDLLDDQNDVHFIFSFRKNHCQLLKDFNKDELRIALEFTGKGVEDGCARDDTRFKELVEAYVNIYKAYVEEYENYIHKGADIMTADLDFKKHCKSVIRKHYIDTLKLAFESLQPTDTHPIGWRDYPLEIEDIVKNYEDFIDHSYEFQQDDRQLYIAQKQQYEEHKRRQREAQEAQKRRYEEQKRQQREAQEAQRRRLEEQRQQEHAARERARRQQQECEAKNLEFCNEIIKAKSNTDSFKDLSMLLYGQNAMSQQELLAFCNDPSKVISIKNPNVYNDIKVKKGLQNSDNGKKIYRFAALLFHPDRYAPTYGFNPGVQHFAAETFKEIGKIN